MKHCNMCVCGVCCVCCVCCVLQEEQRELANTIRVSGSILLSTVSNFLDFFKLEAVSLSSSSSRALHRLPLLSSS